MSFIKGLDPYGLYSYKSIKLTKDEIELALNILYKLIQQLAKDLDSFNINKSNFKRKFNDARDTFAMYIEHMSPKYKIGEKTLFEFILTTFDFDYDNVWSAIYDKYWENYDSDDDYPRDKFIIETYTEEIEEDYEISNQIFYVIYKEIINLRDHKKKIKNIMDDINTLSIIPVNKSAIGYGGIIGTNFSKAMTRDYKKEGNAKQADIYKRAPLVTHSKWNMKIDRAERKGNEKIKNDLKSIKSKSVLDAYEISLFGAVISKGNLDERKRHLLRSGILNQGKTRRQIRVSLNNARGKKRSSSSNNITKKRSKSKSKTKSTSITRGYRVRNPLMSRKIKKY